MNEDDIIKQKAVDYARSIKKEFAKNFTRPYESEDTPVSVFMAGSPGAGKTESSLRLLEDFSQFSDNQEIMRIDPDDFRKELDGYNGSNSYLFHHAVSILADAIHDRALDQQQSFIFDGTFSNIDIARKNIERSLRRKRFIQIFYVYQDPIQAWRFVEARERSEGRNIKKEDFIQKYFTARDVVNQIKSEFSSQVQVDLLLKNTDGSDRVYWQNIETIDKYIKEKYTEDMLNKLI